MGGAVTQIGRAHRDTSVRLVIPLPISVDLDLVLSGRVGGSPSILFPVPL
jgi:hypothetical protein